MSDICATFGNRCGIHGNVSSTFAVHGPVTGLVKLADY